MGKNLIDKAEQVKFIEANKIKYEGEIDFGKEVSKYIEQANSYGYPPLNTEQVFVGFLARIEMYLDDVCNEKTTKKTVTKSEPKTVVNVQQNNNQTVNQNIEITIEQCFKRLDDCESISEEEIQKIKEQINEIECLLKDKLGKKKTIKEKIGNILKIIAEKGTDVMISVLPTIVQMLSQ